MTDLAKRGPLGLKQTKAYKKPKPMRQISKKRAAYRASKEGKAGLDYMALVKALPCVICGATPVEVHHLPSPRSDFRVIPLCPHHHRQEYGPQAYHYSRRNFNSKHGSDEKLLEKTKALLES